MQLQVLRPATFLKGSQQSVSCEYCEIFKNSFLYRTPPVSASEYYPGKMKLKTHFYFEKRKILYCTEVRFYSFFFVVQKCYIRAVVLCITRASSLFCSIRIYTSLHFLLILLKI